jgi:hypothetical protein
MCDNQSGVLSRKGMERNVDRVATSTTELRAKSLASGEC